MVTWTEFYSREVDVTFYLDNIGKHRAFLNSILKEKPMRAEIAWGWKPYKNGSKPCGRLQRPLTLIFHHARTWGTIG